MDERLVMIFRSMLFILIFLFLSFKIISQTKNVGKIISYSKTQNGIEGKTISSYFQIAAYNDNTVRVRISKNEIKDNFSYVLESTELSNYNAEVNEESNFIVISTNKIDAYIEKEPALRVTFKNKSGKIE